MSKLIMSLAKPYFGLSPMLFRRLYYSLVLAPKLKSLGKARNFSSMDWTDVSEELILDCLISLLRQRREAIKREYGSTLLLDI